MPSHNCIIMKNNVQFSRCIWISLRDSMKPQLSLLLQSISFKEVVGQNGLEPSTSRLSVVCSSQLSYWPISRRNQIHNLRFEISISKLTCGFVSPLRIKPASLGFASVPHLWWRVPGSNRWPPACKAGALPAELTPHTRDSYFLRCINLYPLNWITLLNKLSLLPLYWP